MPDRNRKNLPWTESVPVKALVIVAGGVLIGFAYLRYEASFNQGLHRNGVDRSLHAVLKGSFSLLKQVEFADMDESQRVQLMPTSQSSTNVTVVAGDWNGDYRLSMLPPSGPGMHFPKDIFTRMLNRLSEDQIMGMRGYALISTPYSYDPASSGLPALEDNVACQFRLYYGSKDLGQMGWDRIDAKTVLVHIPYLADSSANKLSILCRSDIGVTKLIQLAPLTPLKYRPLGKPTSTPDFRASTFENRVLMPHERMSQLGDPPGTNWFMTLQRTPAGDPGKFVFVRAVRNEHTLVNQAFTQTGQTAQRTAFVTLPADPGSKVIELEVAVTEPMASHSELKATIGRAEVEGAHTKLFVDQPITLKIPQAGTIEIPKQTVTSTNWRGHPERGALTISAYLSIGSESPFPTLIDIHWIGPDPSNLGLQTLQILGRTNTTNIAVDRRPRTVPVSIALRADLQTYRVLRMYRLTVASPKPGDTYSPTNNRNTSVAQISGRSTQSTAQIHPRAPTH
jgi:hypothetical protein